MIKPQVYTRNTHILPVQRTVTPGVRGQVQPTQGTSSISVETTVYPSRPVVGSIILAAQEASNTRRFQPYEAQPYKVSPYPSSPADGSQTSSQARASEPALVLDKKTQSPHSETSQPLAGASPTIASPTGTNLAVRPPRTTEFTRAQQAYTGAGAQDGRVFASSSPGETFYTGSRKTVDVLV